MIRITYNQILKYTIVSVAIINFLVGLIVMVGWVVKNNSIIQLHPYFAPMQFNTALCFTFIGLAMIGVLFKKKPLVRVTVTLAGSISLLTVIEHLFGLDLFIDNLFVEAYQTANTSFPGRMAPSTAMCFLISTISLFIIAKFRNNKYQLGGVLGTLVFSLSIGAFLGYVIEYQSGYAWGEWTHMSLHATFCFLLYGIALTFLNWYLIKDSKNKEKRLKPLIIGYVISLSFLIFLIDVNVPLGVSAGIGYILVLITAFFANSKNLLTIFLVSSLGLVMLVLEISNDANVNMTTKSSRILTLFVLVIVYFLLRLIQDNHRKQRDQNKLLDNMVTERSNELVKRNNELEQFSYISTHDLQEPLRTIRSYSEILKDQYSGSLDELGNKSVEFVHQAAVRMNYLIRALLAYSKLGKGVVLRRMNIEQVIEKAKAEIADKIIETKTVITFDSMPNLMVFNDEIILLFQNLFENAINYQKPNESPKIHISVKPLHAHYEFCVSDNGIGIGEEYLDKIFNLFQRLHSQNEIPGTGIGLSQCKKITNLHNGEISVKSEPGKGSQFYFTIFKHL